MQQSSLVEKNAWLPDLRELSAFIGLVTLCTYGACALFQVTGKAAVIWPADGVLLGILFTSRRTTWPIYFLFGFAASMSGARLAGLANIASLKIALTNGFEIFAAMAVARQFPGADGDLSQAKSLWRLALVTSVFVSATATISNFGLGLLPIEIDSSLILIASFLAHMLGIITIAPTVLAFRRGEFEEYFASETAIKIVCAFALLLVITELVFNQSRYPLLFLVFPPLVLVVVMAGFKGGALSLLLATLISIGFTVANHGPLMLISSSTYLERVIIIQLFLTVAAIMVLVLSVLLAARDRAELQLRSAKDDLAQLATTDGLTGLANRRRMNEILDLECRRAARDKIPLSFLLLDVDHFKCFNDEYGHQAGDECLRTIAATFKSFGRRPGDLSARYGGEELALILPATDEAGAMKTAEAVRAAIEALGLQHVDSSGYGVVTASIGIATAGQKHTPYHPEALIKAADEFLYEAKRTGRNRVISALTKPSDRTPPVLHNEEPRVAMVDRYHAVHSEPSSQALDHVARLAANMLNTPVALVSLVGRDEQVFVGRYGFEATKTSRDVSFCAHVIAGDSPMVVPNALEDPRFKNNPLVTDDPNIRFYAGAPLVSSQDRLHLGALCVIDRQNRAALTDHQKSQLSDLARVAMTYIEQDIAASSKTVMMDEARIDSRDVA